MRDVLVTFLIRSGGAGVALVLQLILSRLMTVEDYGAQALVWTWLLAIGSFGTLGFAESSIRFIPRYIQRRRQNHVHAFQRHAMRSVLVGTILVALCGLMVSASGALPTFTADVLAFICAGLPFFALEHLAEGVARSRGWFRIATVTIYLVRPVGIALICLVLHFNGVELTFKRVTVIVLGGLICTSLFLSVMMLLNRQPEPKPSQSQARFWRAVSLPLLLSSGLEDLTTYAGILLVGVLLGPGEAAVYFAATRVLVLAGFVNYAITYVSGRVFSMALAEGGHERLQQEARKAQLLTIASAMAAGIAIIAAGPWLLQLFGTVFAQGYPVLVVLTLGVVAKAFAGQMQNTLLVRGQMKRLIAVHGLSLAVSVFLMLILIPLWDAMGAAMATALAAAVTSAVFLYAGRKVPMSRAPVAPLLT